MNNNGMAMVGGTSTTSIGNPNNSLSTQSGAIHRRERKPSRTEDAATVAALALAASAGVSSAMAVASSSSATGGGGPNSSSNSTATGGNYGRSTEV